MRASTQHGLNRRLLVRFASWARYYDTKSEFGHEAPVCLEEVFVLIPNRALHSLTERFYIIINAYSMTSHNIRFRADTNGEIILRKKSVCVSKNLAVTFHYFSL